ncbi:hypothetical protein Sviol_49430 [Streptomyces violascens]|uniref:Uncharacterized protein n=1 Tax=Streptomyces violascens TaxID=67381 RepID=A0ABQ3QTE7_9ACTN|nr:hypothetical protein Sviol_49430 [Streptomyces violascens]
MQWDSPILSLISVLASIAPGAGWLAYRWLSREREIKIIERAVRRATGQDPQRGGLGG